MDKLDKPLNAKELIQSLSSIRLINEQCMYGRCVHVPIHSHTLSRSSIRNFKSKTGIKVVMFCPFNTLKSKEKRKYFGECLIKKFSTFPGFCSAHDHELFKPVDNFNGTITKEIALLSHYRIICYGIYITKNQIKIMEELSSKKPVGPASKKSKDIARKIKSGFFMRRLQMALDDYLLRKELCEQMISNKDYSQINFIECKGSNNDPLFCGRAGSFVHGFPDKRLPIRFLPQMPFITYTSFHNKDSCCLIFTMLNIDEHYTNLTFFDSSNFRKKIEVLAYSQSDFCIVSENILNQWKNDIQKIHSHYA